MNRKTITASLLILLSSVAITGASLLVTRHGQSLICVPVYGDARDQIHSYQRQRGFPEWFYEEGFPPNCQSFSPQGIEDTNTSSQFHSSAMIQDFVVWLIVSTVIIGTIVKIRDKHE